MLHLAAVIMFNNKMYLSGALTGLMETTVMPQQQEKNQNPGQGCNEFSLPINRVETLFFFLVCSSPKGNEQSWMSRIIIVRRRKIHVLIFCQCMNTLKIVCALHCNTIWKNNSCLLCICLRYSPHILKIKKVPNCFLKNNKHSTLGWQRIILRNRIWDIHNLQCQSVIFNCLFFSFSTGTL